MRGMRPPPHTSPQSRRRLACASALGLLAIAGGLVSPAALAQLRNFPPKTKVGMLQMGNFPEALLDNQRIRFAPGVRLLNEHNIAVVPMSIEGPKRIRYRLDSLGQIDLAWILTTAEAQAVVDK